MPTHKVPASESTEDLSPDVQGALQALDAEFHQLGSYALAAGRLCYLSAHRDEWSEADDRHAELFVDWCNRHPATDQHHRDLITQNTVATTLAAYREVYFEMVTAAAVARIDEDTRRWVRASDADFEGRVPAAYDKEEIPASPKIFAELVEIGCKHFPDGVGWAADQLRRMIDKHLPHLAREWASAACAGDPAGTQMESDAAVDGLKGKLAERLEAAVADAYLAAAQHPPARGVKVSEAEVSAVMVEVPHDPPEPEKPVRKKKSPAEECTPERRDMLIDLVDRMAVGTVTVAEAACILRVSKGTIYNMIGGALTKTGRRITAASLRAYLVKLEVLTGDKAC